MRFVLAWSLAGAVVALAACGAAILNPDPVHGGACRNGDQECQVCPNGARCPGGTHCPATGGGCEADPPYNPNADFLGARARDAGADR